MLTLSVVRTGAEHVHPTVLMAAKAALHRAVAAGLIIDGQVAGHAADVSLIMVHRRGVDSPGVRGLVDGPSGCAELEFTERPDEQVVCLFADHTPAYVWNLPLYRMFADPLTMARATNGGPIRDEFSFEIHDLFKNKHIRLDTPADLRDLLMVLSTPSRYVAHAVFSKTRYLTAAVTSAPLSSQAGPVLIVRAQSGLPTPAEIWKPFTMPGVAPVVALAFQIREGRLVGPRAVFSTDRAPTAVAAGAR